MKLHMIFFFGGGENFILDHDFFFIKWAYVEFIILKCIITLQLNLI